VVRNTGTRALLRDGMMQRIMVDLESSTMYTDVGPCCDKQIWGKTLHLGRGKPDICIFVDE
jgi:hypothetical protein